MNNKTILLILFLSIVRNTYQQIQNKTDEFEKIDETNRNLKASDFTLVDAMKRIQQLENNIQAIINTNTNNQNKLIAKILELQNSQNSYVKKQDLKIKNMASIVDGIPSKIEKMKNDINNISENIPQTYFYYPSVSPSWSYKTTPIDKSTNQHPLSTKLIIKKYSLVTISINGYINTNGQSLFVNASIDNKPIAGYNNLYYNVQDGIDSVDQVQETILEKGTYLVEIICICNYCKSQTVTFSGLSYTIKVQELPDPIKK